jgi:adenosine deaminase
MSSSQKEGSKQVSSVQVVDNPVNASPQFFDNDFIQHSIPKVELHAHLNGCIRSNTLQELATERNVIYDFASFDIHKSGSSRQRRTLEECFEIFSILPLVITDLEALQRITQEALTDFSTHHVSYFEVRSTPKRLLNKYKSIHNIPGIIDTDVSTKQQYIETVLDTIINFNESEECRYQLEMNIYRTSSESQPMPRLPMVTRFIVSIDQSKSLNECDENIQLAINFFSLQNKYKDMVVGVDFCGNPNYGNWSMFRPSFERARKSGLKVTIHCAELPIKEVESEDEKQLQSQTEDQENRLYLEAKSMLDFHPDRLGHAIQLPSSLLRILLQQKIPVETCPTSNIMTTQMYNDHVSSPAADENLSISTDFVGITRNRNVVLRYWIQSCHPIIVCTDDPTIFDTTITNEIMIVLNAFAPEGLITLPQFLDNLVINAMNYCFCNETTKHLVVERMKERIGQIVKSNFQ